MVPLVQDDGVATVRLVNDFGCRVIRRHAHQLGLRTKATHHQLDVPVREAGGAERGGGALVRQSLEAEGEGVNRPLAGAVERFEHHVRVDAAAQEHTDRNVAHGAQALCLAAGTEGAGRVRRGGLQRADDDGKPARRLRAAQHG